MSGLGGRLGRRNTSAAARRPQGPRDPLDLRGAWSREPLSSSGASRAASGSQEPLCAAPGPFGGAPSSTSCMVLVVSGLRRDTTLWPRGLDREARAAALAWTDGASGSLRVKEPGGAPGGSRAGEETEVVTALTASRRPPPPTLLSPAQSGLVASGPAGLYHHGGGGQAGGPLQQSQCHGDDPARTPAAAQNGRVQFAHKPPRSPGQARRRGVGGGCCGSCCPRGHEALRVPLVTSLPARAPLRRSPGTI